MKLDLSVHRVPSFLSYSLNSLKGVPRGILQGLF